MNRSSLILLGLMALTLAGCATLKQPSPRVEYYTLEYQAPTYGMRPALPVTLRMERFTVAPPYDTDRMIYRDHEFDRSAYFYHKWRANPADLVTYFLGRDLRQGGRFQAVSSPGSGLLPHTHTIAGEVDEFLEWDSYVGWDAVLSLHITLVAAREPDSSKQVLLQQQFSARQPCAAKEPREVARAMSLAMAEISRQVGEAIYLALADQGR